MMEGSEAETASLLRVRIEDDSNSYGSVAVIDAHSRPSPNYHSISKQHNGILAKGPRSSGRLSDYDPIEFDLDRAAIRLSWQGVTVTLPPKSRRCCDVISRKKGNTGEGYASKQILTNSNFLFLLLIECFAFELLCYYVIFQTKVEIRAFD